MMEVSSVNWSEKVEYKCDDKTECTETCTMDEYVMKALPHATMELKTKTKSP